MQSLWFNKPKYLEEIFVTKNAFFTKHELERSVSKPLLNENIVNMNTDDPAYKKKRKALSSAFLKSKMTDIIQMIKGTALQCFAELQAKGDENEVDLNLYTSAVQAHIIVTLMMGPGHSFKTLEYTDLWTREVSKITIADFMDRILVDIMARLLANPLLTMSETLNETPILASDKAFHANSVALRSFIGDIIEKKKADKDMSAQDVTSLLLQDENYQDTNAIVDDVLVMFIAGSKTV
jgi:cytochrome P450